MTTHLSLAHEYDADLPPEYTDEVRAPEALVEHALREYSDPGDDVVDPFAGFGTTLVVAERLGRTPHGLEYEHEGEVTPLAWDVAGRVSRTFRFDGEIVVTWEPGGYNDRTDDTDRGGGTYGYGYDHTCCLVFTNAAD